MCITSTVESPLEKIIKCTSSCRLYIYIIHGDKTHADLVIHLNMTIINRVPSEIYATIARMSLHFNHEVQLEKLIHKI